MNVMSARKTIVCSLTLAGFTFVLLFGLSSVSAQKSSEALVQTDWNATRTQALASSKKREYAASEKILQQMIKRAARMKDSDGHLLIALEDLGSVYANEHKYGEAREIYKRVLAIDERKYGVNSPKLIKPLNDVIKVTCIDGKCYDTIPQLNRLLVIRRKAYGHDSREIPVMLLLLGEANEKEGKYAEAISYFTEAVNTQKKISGENSAMVIALSQNLERASKEQSLKLKQTEKAQASATRRPSVR